jgi:hypothetical protein
MGVGRTFAEAMLKSQLGAGSRLPRKGKGAPIVLDVLDSHLLVGSEREQDESGEVGDYVDKCENHLMLANAYSALAETIGGHAVALRIPPPKSFPRRSPRQQARRNRSVEA